jgi:hypothetical protein
MEKNNVPLNLKELSLAKQAQTQVQEEVQPAVPSDLENIYAGNAADLHTITQSEPGKKSGLAWLARYKRMWLGLGLLLVAMVLLAGVYAYWQRPAAPAPVANWYVIKLASGETFFAQLSDTLANPLVLENAYSDFRDGGSETNIRLVRRGKQTYGTTGKVLVFRDNLAYIEELSPDSRVLEAIKDYQK